MTGGKRENVRVELVRPLGPERRCTQGVDGAVVGLPASGLDGLLDVGLGLVDVAEQEVGGPMGGEDGGLTGRGGRLEELVVEVVGLLEGWSLLSTSERPACGRERKGRCGGRAVDGQ